MCVPDAARQAYFQHCCAVLGLVPVMMNFQDYMGGEPFSQNSRDEMRSQLMSAVRGQTFDLAFTHSRGEHGEYWSRHANHVEVRELAAELAGSQTLGFTQSGLAYFAYDVIYGGGTATCARLDADYYLPLTHPELLWKCQLCSLAPDAESSLHNLVYPCPNPEAFEGDGLVLETPLVRRV